MPPSIIIDNQYPKTVYTIHDIVEPFTHRCQLLKNGEFYMDETIIHNFGAPLKIEAGIVPCG